MNWTCCDVEVPGDSICGWPQEYSRWVGRVGHPQRAPHSTPTSTDTAMAREQPNVGDLVPLLETSDLHQLDEIRGLINEQLSSGKAALFV